MKYKVNVLNWAEANPTEIANKYGIKRIPGRSSLAKRINPLQVSRGKKFVPFVVTVCRKEWKKEMRPTPK